MNGTELVLVALLMAVGLVGVLVPLLPGLPVVLAAGVWWAVADGGGGRWVVVALMALLGLAGTAAKYVLPARAVGGAGAPRSTLLAGLAGAVVGFFVIPVVGLVIGGVAAVYLAELSRLGDGRRAWASTRQVLLAVGIGMLLELGAGVAMALAWAVAELTAY